MHKEEIFQILASQNIAKAVVGFTGGSDEGEIETMDLLDADDKLIRSIENDYEIIEIYNSRTGLNEVVPGQSEPTVDQRLAELLENVVRRNVNFNGNVDIDGTVIWNTADKLVTLGTTHHRYEELEN